MDDSVHESHDLLQIVDEIDECSNCGQCACHGDLSEPCEFAKPNFD